MSRCHECKKEFATFYYLKNNITRLCKDCFDKDPENCRDKIREHSDDTGGKKFDDGKLRFDLIPPEVNEELAKILTMGAKKYEPNNWQKVESGRYVAALYRHLNSWQKGETMDSESHMRHLSHALCNVAFLLWIEINNDK